MSIFTGDFTVYAGEQPVGTVTVSQKGLLTVFDCICTYKSREVLRLAAVCSGKNVPLGVLLPEENALRLKKSFSKNALAGIGFDNANTFYLICPGDIGTSMPPGPAAAIPPLAEEPPTEEPAPDMSSFDMPAPEIPGTLSPAEPGPEETAFDEPAIPAASEPAVPTADSPMDDSAPYGIFPVISEDTAVSEPDPEPAAEPAVSEELANQLLSALLQMTSQKDEPPAGTEQPAEAVQLTETVQAAGDALAARDAPSARDVQAAGVGIPDDAEIPIFDELEAYDDVAPEYEDGWFLADQPSALFQDPEIAATCEDITDALIMEREDCTLLAVPVSHSKPFPMMSIFCFGTSRLLGRQEYIIFKIKNGYLTL